MNIKTEQVRAIAEKVDTSAVADVYITHTHVCIPQICKFLVSLSKDFSSYYNRVHVLGVRMYSYIHIYMCVLTEGSVYKLTGLYYRYCPTRSRFYICTESVYMHLIIF